MHLRYRYDDFCFISSLYSAFISGHLSLDIPLWVCAVSTGQSWDKNRQTTHCISPECRASQCKLVPGRRVRRCRSVPSCGPYGLGKIWYFLHNLSLSYFSLLVYIYFIVVKQHWFLYNFASHLDDNVLRVIGGDIALYGKAIPELWRVSCHMGSHSVTCHPTQVNVPRLNPSQMGWYSIYLPRRDGRLS